MRSKAKIAFLVMALAFVCHGCGIYSFTGASIPPEAKTVSVAYFPNHAQLVNPLLSNGFTSALRDAIMNQTPLEMVDSGFSNRFDETKDFEQSFSQYEDYPSDQDLNAVQEDLTTVIVEALVEDIFNKALVNW